jgi:hypothetical protein
MCLTDTYAIDQPSPLDGLFVRLRTLEASDYPFIR